MSTHDFKCKGCDNEKKHYALGLDKDCYDSWRRQRNWLAKGLNKLLRNPYCINCGARPVKRIQSPALCASCLALSVNRTHKK